MTLQRFARPLRGHIGQARVHEAKLAGGLAELTLGVAPAPGVAPNLRHDLRGEREAAGEERPYERLVEHLWSALNCEASYAGAPTALSMVLSLASSCLTFENNRQHILA